MCRLLSIGWKAAYRGTSSRCRELDQIRRAENFLKYTGDINVRTLVYSYFTLLVALIESSIAIILALYQMSPSKMT